LSFALKNSICSKPISAKVGSDFTISAKVFDADILTFYFLSKSKFEISTKPFAAKVG
jgi:hypothetical protein